MRPSRNRAFVVIVAAALLILLAPWLRQSLHRDWTMSDFSSQKLKWSSCFQSDQCAVLTVPINYQDLKQGTFPLFVLKHPASNPSKRVGALVVNPGGPGASGAEYAYGAQEIVSAAVSSSFDVVGFDPRGVGRSAPFRCFNDAQTDEYLSADGRATTAQEISRVDSYAKKFAQACGQAAGAKLGHYSTLETAKDMDLLRSALGENTLNFLGKSYGTFLGTLYAVLYPQRVGRFVLDGAVDPNASIRDQNLAQAVGFESALDDFFAHGSSYSKAELLTFLEKSQREPLLGNSGRKLTPSLAVIGIAASLYENQSGWPALEAALKAALREGRAEPLLALADGYTNRDSSGHFTDNINDISQVISCLDWVDPRSLSSIAADNARFAQAAPLFGPYLTFAGLTCLHWQSQPQLLGKKIERITSPTPLIIGVSKDPATPLIWAKALAKDFKASRLLVLDGEGHTGYYRGVSCIDNAVDRFLLKGLLPEQNLTCTA